MSAAADRLEAARRVADAVLYEGYVLFPYRASAHKNRYRWQFGVVIPARQEAAGTAEPSAIASRCLLRATPDARVRVSARFLRVRRRQMLEADGSGFRPVEQVDVDGALHTTWDEGVEQEVAIGPVPLAELAVGAREVAFDLPGEHDAEALRAAGGAVVARADRRAEPVAGVVRLAARRLDGDVVRLETDVRNVTDWADPTARREDVIMRSFVGVHLLLTADGGAFASLTDPPSWAAPWVAELDNRHTYPVLAGQDRRDDVVLSAPIILPDHPEIAAESPGDSYDATEIDELLTLAVRSLTDEEKRQARATDPRAAAVVERADALPPAVLERLHGAVRQFEPRPPPRRPAVAGGHDAALDDDLAEFLGIGEDAPARLEVDGRTFSVGDRLRLVPRRRADAQDLFAAGRVARLERIETDLEGQVHLAVTLTDDPGADLHAWGRRFLYYGPDEVEPLDS